MSVHHACAWCPRKPEKGVRFPDTGITGIESSGGFWESNSGPLAEQPVLLTTEHLSTLHSKLFKHA